MSLFAAAALLTPICAHADVAQDLAYKSASLLGYVAEATEAGRQLTARAVPAPAGADIAVPHIAIGPAAPSIETPLHRLFCVQYARARSGLAVFGDAKFWWERARNIYARAAHPMEEAVMVFTGSKRLKRGHVAVVTDIVGPREIVVDQANWQNHGEIDHATPVLDVSLANDWSKVRVWDMRSGGFGTHVYAISGFIAKEMTRQASRD